MSIINDTIEVDKDLPKLKALLAKKIELGDKIRGFVESDGFLIIKAIFKNYENDIRSKDDYKNLKEFQADRKALKIVQGMLNDLVSYIGEADQAFSELQKVIEAESSTPSSLSLDGEGTDDEEGQ